nr:MAG TPA: hypothetical protein [Caudoviricetes sp.]DAH95948.1 MAG TPA: hypothetical protein [Caudoviricetes sp.]
MESPEQHDATKPEGRTVGGAVLRARANVCANYPHTRLN